MATVMVTALSPAGMATALADEATGYSVGTPVPSYDEDGDLRWHTYSYPSRTLTAEAVDALPVQMREEDVAGMQVLVLARSFEGDLSGSRRILFIHGGAFVSQLTTEHIWLAARFAKATGAVVYLPAYPVANDYTDYTDTYPPMFELYRRVCEQAPDGGFFVLGDSAGAGLAIGLCQLVAQTDGMRQPDNLILASPWANVTVQPWEGLSGAATAWAGSADAQRTWQVSPTYGRMDKLRRVTIYNGENDGMSESIQMLYHQLRGSNVDCQIVNEHDSTHDYVYLLPRDDACRAFNLICASITGRLSPQDSDMTWVDAIDAAGSFDNGRRGASPSPKSVSGTPAYDGR